MSRRTAAIACVIAILAAGVGDCLTGIEITFTLLYLIPIAYGAWTVGMGFGVALAALAAALGTTAIVVATPTMSPLVTAWNQLGALATFVVIAIALDRLHVYIERERRRLRVAVEQLRHADRLNVIGTLAAGVAHEVGTPLNVISGAAELLAMHPAPPQIDRATRLISEQSQKIARIVRHLLDFGRRAGGARTVVQLAAVVRATVDLLDSSARRRGCTLRIVGDVDVPVSANGPELEQVVSNLVLNAIQAMAGGGEVRLQVERLERLDRAGRTRALGGITVSDTGGGISPEDLPHIFDPFFTTKDVGEGTGLGLSVSYGIVEDHGGVIEVDSTVGRGTKFRVLLPVQGSATSATT